MYRKNMRSLGTGMIFEDNNYVIGSCSLLLVQIIEKLKLKSKQNEENYSSESKEKGEAEMTKCVVFVGTEPGRLKPKRFLPRPAALNYAKELEGSYPLVAVAELVPDGTPSAKAKTIYSNSFDVEENQK